MKKKTWLVAGIILALIAGLLVAPFRFRQKESITIAVPIESVYNQFNDLRNWKHWFPPLINKESSASFSDSGHTSGAGAYQNYKGYRYALLENNPGLMRLKEEKGFFTVYNTLISLPVSPQNHTVIDWIRSGNLLFWLNSEIKGDGEMKTGLSNLKSYMEDPVKRYGFPIEILPVTDTLVLSKNTLSATKDRFLTLSKLYSDIYEYAIRQNIPLNRQGPRLANFSQSGQDSVRVFAGIPVHKRGKKENDINYLNMPASGKMLVAHYKGPYTKLNQVHIILDKYIRDNVLQKVAISYEKYYTQPLTNEDSLHMVIDVLYPIL